MTTALPVTAILDPKTEIRKFEIPSLLSQVDAAVAALGPKKQVAVIGYANREEAGFAVVARIGSNWSFLGKLARPWDKRWEVGVAVVWSGSPFGGDEDGE